MAIYVVMQPPIERPDAETAFIADRFAPIALAIPGFWLLWHRLWVEALVVFAISLAIAAGAQAAGMALALPLLSLLLGLAVALEGSALRIVALVRRGWTEAGVVEASSAAEAELRWFYGQGDELPASEPPTLKPAPAPLQRDTSDDTIGLVDFGGSR